MGSSYAVQDQMDCYDCCNNNQQAPRSMHEGGVNTCFADGSVHWMSDLSSMLRALRLPARRCLSVWDRLILSADGQVIPGNAY